MVPGTAVAVAIEDHSRPELAAEDVVWALGYGFPRERGGPMYWARQVGLPEVVTTLDRLAGATGDPHLAPSRGLLELAVR